MNADKILFHPSALGKIMTGVAKGWDVENSLTCKRELVKIYHQLIFGRYYTHTNKYTEKGVKQEQDGITLHSRFRKKNFKKNTERIENDFFTGEIDIRNKAERETIDIKCSWSLETLPHPLLDKIDADYKYQGLAYLDLDDCDKHTIAYCLVNSTAKQLMREQENLYYAMDCPTLDDGKYLEQLILIEKNMIFDIAQFKRDNPNHDLYCKQWEFDIPIKDRVVEFSFERNDSELLKIKDRIRDCREWMNKNLFKERSEILLAELDPQINAVMVTKG